MRKIIYAVILVFLLAGCSASQQTITAIPTISPTSGPVATETVLPPTQTPTLAATPSVTFPSPPLWTPLPTLSPIDAEERLRTWIQGTFECLLPCWGGITPGLTSWQETVQTIEQLSGFSSVNVSENVSCEFGLCNGVAWSLYPNTIAEGTFYTKFPENIVHMIKINIQNEGNAQKINLLRNIGLQDVFRWYGLPPIFLINVESDLSDNTFMELVLVYPERQSVIRYIKNTELVDGKVTNCGPDHQIEMFILDNKEQLVSLDTIANAVEMRNLQIDDRYKTIEEATGITSNSFFNAISSFGNFCISTPVDMWTP